MTKLGGSKWPAKPREDDLCEASIGVSADAVGQPLVLGCSKPAVETVKMKSLEFELYMCTEHAEHFAAKGQVRRNPRLFK
jgi:hypothetical protein